MTTGGNYRPAIGVRREAKDALAKWCEDHDEEIGKTLSRLIYSFVSADPLVQAVLLRHPIPSVENAYALALRKLADELERKEVAPVDDIDTIPKKKRTG